jgi:hypothetical protein
MQFQAGVAVFRVGGKQPGQIRENSLKSEMQSKFSPKLLKTSSRR